MSVRYKKEIDHLQNELKTKDKIIDQLLKSFISLTNSELESKNNIIHKLLDQTNDEEKKKPIQRQNDINTKSDIADNKSDEKHSSKKTKEHAERNKANNSPNNTESRDVKPKTNKRKKIRVEILGDSMLNGFQEKRLNKNKDINIKIRTYSDIRKYSSTDILEHIRPSLRKEPDQIIIHAEIICNLFINDLMFFIQETEVCNFVHDATIHLCSPNFQEAILKLSNDMHLILNWFS